MQRKPIKKSTAKEIRKLMREKNLTVAQLAKKINNSAGHLNMVLNQKRPCGASTADGLNRWSKGRFAISELMRIK